jgi:hypothetical protein
MKVLVPDLVIADLTAARASQLWHIRCAGPEFLLRHDARRVQQGLVRPRSTLSAPSPAHCIHQLRAPLIANGTVAVAPDAAAETADVKLVARPD